MCNHSSCMVILTKLIGFEKSVNGESITLPDRVGIDGLIQFKNLLQDNNINSNMCSLPRDVCVIPYKTFHSKQKLH